LQAGADNFHERQGREMIIDRLNSIDPIRDPQKALSRWKSREGCRRRFYLHLLGCHQKADLYKAFELAKAAPETRSDRIAELKAKINEPSYIDDAVVSMTADRIIDQLFGS
jgi:negative regulator of flagellin synthesis FlgM